MRLEAVIPLIIALAAPALGRAAEPDPGGHWSFKVPQRPALPTTMTATNPVDALIGIELRKHGLEPVARARPELQLRRLYLDLIGVPPTGAERRLFLADPSPDAWERVVNRLLADPRHGERWARHWMDVWRYSDWFGRRMVPDVWNSAPQIWRWRDWIVQSLNAGKGYDRMIMEMLAGDEVAPGDPATAVATGYLVRNWYALNPNQWMRDNVEHTGKAFLGLTFNCAHCHDHKYDPITREDYFAFRAFFEPLYLRQDRWLGEVDPGKFQDYEISKVRPVVRAGMISVFDRNLDAKTFLYTGGDERNVETNRAPAAPRMPAFLGGDAIKVKPVALPSAAWFPGLKLETREAELRSAARAAAEAKGKWQQAVSRLGEARDLLLAEAGSDEAARALRVACEEKASRAVALEDARFTAASQQQVTLQARIAADDVKFGGKAGDLAALSMAAWQSERRAAVSKAKATMLELEWAVADSVAQEKGAAPGKMREDAAAAARKAEKLLESARKTLAKAEEDARTPAADYTPLSPVYPRESTGRRQALAEWIAHPRNPLTARVAVNYIWMHHFHAPLVASVFDFGRNGASPTHPALLDWLAVELMESGWDMKHLHRLIVTSEAYRRRSDGAGEASGEATRQSAASLDPENKFLWRMHTGRMEAEVVRDSVLHLAGALDPTMGGPELENTEMPRSTRRSLYFSCHPESGGKGEFTALFDAPDAAECYRRSRTVIPQQALALTNSAMVHDQCGPLARRIAAAAASSDDPGFITAACEEILSRPPRAAELRECGAFLEQQRGELHGPDAARESLVRVLLNHHDFITIR